MTAAQCRVNYHFCNLSYPDRMDILIQLGLLEEEDARRNFSQLHSVLWDRIEQKELFDEFSREVKCRV